ncbi:hypothetical protein NB311A_20641 [Nitrobacter sp. Nb-311A]|uniref:lysylphosphatidylglycerol synthase transmembrane domain-containing protein n=1 Tax=Nitrobacter sp. Nb-311A TaxID=314253 RepID=UPI0000687A58|nr:lysylphosphatidylglycerol synthase transmembrane domain-containing protein [Nitrobacter sp. Nb-311A]EAQ36384.1 hypothetical protein NB311A_20641 [Nitrobacter sp. Nb-311A]
MRGILLLVIKIAVSIALLVLALRKVDFSDVAARIDLVTLWWLIFALAAVLLQIFFGALRWREIAQLCGAPLTIWHAFRLNMIAAFFNQALPSSVGGDAMRVWFVGRGGAGWRAAGYSVLIDRAIGLAVLAVLIAGSLPWSLRLIADPHGRVALLLVDVAAIAGGIGFLVLGFLPWRWLTRWQIIRHVRACSQIAGRLVTSRVHGPSLVILSLLVNVLNAVVAWAVIRSIGADASFAQLFLLIPPVMLVTTIPVSIAGWGLREATMALAFAYAALRPEDGVGASLLFGIVNFLAGGLGGVVWIVSSKLADPDDSAVDEAGEVPSRVR